MSATVPVNRMDSSAVPLLTTVDGVPTGLVVLKVNPVVWDKVMAPFSAHKVTVMRPPAASTSLI